MSNTMDIQNLMSLHNAVMYDCKDIVSVKDTDLHYISVNKAFLNAFGIKDERNIIGKGIEKILKYENQKIIEKKSKEIMKKIVPQSYILNLEKECGIRFSKITSCPILENGTAAGILTVIRDNSQEEKFKLKLIEKLYVINSLLENLPILVFIKDTNNNYITGSKYAKKFFSEGLDIYSDNICLNMNDITDMITLEDENIKRNTVVIIDEKTCKSADGNQHWYKIYKAPVLDSDNNINGIITIIRNIDAEKQLEIQKELFLATLTHDLKTPIQAQISSLEMLNKGSFGQINEKQKEILSMIIESSNFMKEMLYSILTVYKYEKGMACLCREYFNMENLIKLCIKEAYYLALEKNTEIEYNNSAGLGIIYADESQIRRVIANLLNNAVNYAYKNTKIYVKLFEDDNYTKISIKNTSTPIAQNLCGHIFEKYVSGMELGKKHGIGLGLYFCKIVIEAHKGKICLNTCNIGNEFVVALPKKRTDIPENALKFI